MSIALDYIFNHIKNNKNMQSEVNVSDKLFTNTDIRKLYRMDSIYKSVKTLYNAEERGDIPKAERVARGKIMVRYWKAEQLPEIGAKFGFLQLPKKQIIISTFIQKGGVLKTTTSFNIARTLALNGIKTLIIGLDSECSITDVLLPRAQISNIEETEKTLGLFHIMVEHAPIKNVIKKTSLSTLDIIPETHDLVVLNKWINNKQRREYVFNNTLISQLKDYDVIIFDNGPSWNHLIENSIVSSNVIVLPLGCNILSYNACETNLSTILEFQQTMDLHTQKLIMFPTLLEKTSLSQQIFAKYLSKFAKYIIPVAIRRSVKGEEALIHRQTVLEYAPTSPLADDYFDLLKTIWSNINETQVTQKESNYNMEVV